MTDRPTTAAPHKVLAEAMERERPGWTMPITEHDWEMWGSRVEMTLQAFGFTVAARQPDSEALRNYLHHRWNCEWKPSGCTCGLDAALALAALPPSAPPAPTYDTCTHAEGCICTDPEHSGCCGALRPKVLAAMAAQPAPLDVERLAEALCLSIHVTGQWPIAPVLHRERHRTKARSVAVEYARLATSPEDRP